MSRYVVTLLSAYNLSDSNFPEAAQAEPAKFEAEQPTKSTD